MFLSIRSKKSSYTIDDDGYGTKTFGNAKDHITHREYANVLMSDKQIEHKKNKWIQSSIKSMTYTKFDLQRFQSPLLLIIQ